MLVRFKTDFDKYVVVANLKRRGWEEVTCVLDEDWCACWAALRAPPESTLAKQCA